MRQLGAVVRSGSAALSDDDINRPDLEDARRNSALAGT